MNRSEISNYYNTISNSYEELYGEEQLTKYTTTLSSRLINLDNITTILDIGCGSGLLVKYLAKKEEAKKIYYIGIEISHLLLKKAQFASENMIVDYILTDGEDPPIRLQSIDLITLYTVVHHFRDPIKSIVKLVNREGKLIIVTFLCEDETLINKLLLRIQGTKGSNYKSEIYKYRNKEMMLVLSLL